MISKKTYTQIVNRLKIILPIALVLTLFLTFFIYKYFNSKPVFSISEASLFPISNNSRSLLMDKFGVTGNTTKVEQEYNLDELLKSRTIKEQIISKYINTKDGSILLADLLIEDEKSINKQISNPKLLSEKIQLASSIVGSRLILTKQKSDFYILKAKAFNEDLAINLNLMTIEVLAKYYVKLNFRSLSENLELVSKSKDSLEHELIKYENAYASYLDETKYVKKSKYKLPEIRFERKIEEITDRLIATRESYYSLETQNKTLKPILRILDYPQKPLQNENKNNSLIIIILAIVFFIILCILGFIDIISHSLNKLIQEQKSKLISVD